MRLHGEFVKRAFVFNFDARTSRGAMKERVSWIIRLTDRDKPGVVGYGECAPLPGLSIDDLSAIERKITDSLGRLARLQSATLEKVPAIVNSCVEEGFPSLTFGLETALLDLLNGGKRQIFDTPFLKGSRIPINGLVWMGDLPFMKEQLEKKIEQGFRCIKIKVGSLDFKEECKLLRYVRQTFSDLPIEIRLDANGAFSESDALAKLNALAEFNIHSIEQPLPVNSHRLATVISSSPIPIALDEELIGCENSKASLLDAIRPHYIILKPGLHGGLFHCADWIAQAEERTIGWWITSALESNIGLNAICQFASRYPITLPQGLGTGGLYQNNIPSPLTVSEGYIFYDDGMFWPADLWA